MVRYLNRKETPLGIVLLIMGVLIVTTPTKADVTLLNVSYDPTREIYQNTTRHSLKGNPVPGKYLPVSLGFNRWHQCKYFRVVLPAYRRDPKARCQ